MNMFKLAKAKSVKEYFEMLPKERKLPMKFLHEFILKTAPKLKPTFAYNMPGYGTFKYKNYISIYVCAVKAGEYIAEKYKNDLGKVSVGRSCIRFKNIEDLNLKTLEKVIKLAAKSPGLSEARK